MSELVFRDAVDLAASIRGRELSAREVMQAHLEQIERHNPRLVAIVNGIDPERALALADEADAALARGDAVGPLHGLPVAIKDAVDVAGLPTTFGCPLFESYVPDRDGLLTGRMREAGLLVIGKTNMPELGLGSHTFNPVFGTTRNPYDPRKSAGGSSGGAAVALATGMLPIADGSDLGGSLRNPAAFCNVIGLRPSIGRIPAPLSAYGWLARMSTQGPMGRSVRDVATLLAVQAGPHPDDPLSLPDCRERLLAPLDRDVRGLRVAFSPDLGLPVQAEIRRVCEQSAAILCELGCTVEETAPDLSGAMEVFQVQRAAAMVPLAGVLERRSPDWREVLKDTAVWNIEKGLGLDAAAILRSEVERAQIHRRAAAFFENHDFLILPATQVVPFDVDVEWVREIEGTKLETYLDWMSICCMVTVTGLPALSIPAGFTRDGLPVGLQMVGPPRGERALLELARAFEQANPMGQRRPPLVAAV